MKCFLAIWYWGILTPGINLVGKWINLKPKGSVHPNYNPPPPTFLTHLQLYLVMQKVCIVVVVVTYPSAEISALVLKFGLCSSQHLKVLLKQSNNAAPYNPDKSPQQSMLWKEIFLMQSFDSASITIQFTYLIRWNTTRGKENMTFVARWTDPMTGVSLPSDDTSMSECLNTECKSVFIHVWMSHMCVLFFSES